MKFEKAVHHIRASSSGDVLQPATGFSSTVVIPCKNKCKGSTCVLYAHGDFPNEQNQCCFGGF